MSRRPTPKGSARAARASAQRTARTQHRRNDGGGRVPSKCPAPDQVKAARIAAGLTQLQAGEILHTNVRVWQQWEYGETQMHPAFFELFMLKTARIRKRLAEKATLGS